MVTAKLTKGTVATISDGSHTWTADEPTHLDGTDTGPTPYDLLLGALASCTCITVALYCRHKNLPLDSITASFEHESTHIDDCKDCENPEKGFIEQIKSQVHITGTFDHAQRQRLTQVAKRCPVHKTIANGIKIDDNIAFI